MDFVPQVNVLHGCQSMADPSDSIKATQDYGKPSFLEFVVALFLVKSKPQELTVKGGKTAL